MSELRQDPITARWSIVAESRAARPNDYSSRRPPSSPADCPFCEGHESWTTEEVAADRAPGLPPNGPGWSVRAFPNKFPTVAPGARLSEEDVGGRPGGRRPGLGHHEVVIAGRDHVRPLAGYDSDAARRVLSVLRDRIGVLSQAPGVEACVAFENSGPESGGTLFHPHLQIVALPTVPPLLREESEGLARFAREHPGACGYESVAGDERDRRVRVVSEGPGFTAFAPFASEHPFELRILPRRHCASLADATGVELVELAGLVPAVLTALDAVAPGASYNLVTRSFARNRPEALAYHWHLDLLPRLVRADGFEVGAGVAVNPVSPESAAAALRTAIAAARGPSREARSAPKL